MDSSLAVRRPLPIPAGLAGSVSASHLAHLPELFCGSVGSIASPPPPLVDLDDGPSYVSGPASCGGPLPMPFPNGLAISQPEAVALAETHAVRRAHAARPAPPPPHCRRGAHTPHSSHTRATRHPPAPTPDVRRSPRAAATTRASCTAPARARVPLCRPRWSRCMRAQRRSRAASPRAGGTVSACGWCRRRVLSCNKTHVSTRTKRGVLQSRRTPAAGDS